MLKRLFNNFRRGFATNSSSSHSLVYYKTPIDSGSAAVTTDVEFGWNHFVLSNLGDKLMYALVALLEGSSSGSYWSKPSDLEIDTAHAQYGHLFPEFSREDFALALTGYIDHESRSVSGEELIKIARNPHVEIHGGNDNDGYDVYDAVLDGGDNVDYGVDLSYDDEKITPEIAAERGKDRWW